MTIFNNKLFSLQLFPQRLAVRQSTVKGGYQPSFIVNDYIKPQERLESLILQFKKDVTNGK